MVTLWRDCYTEWRFNVANTSTAFHSVCNVQHTAKVLSWAINNVLWWKSQFQLNFINTLLLNPSEKKKKNYTKRNQNESNHSIITHENSSAMNRIRRVAQNRKHKKMHTFSSVSLLKVWNNMIYTIIVCCARFIDWTLAHQHRLLNLYMHCLPSHSC